MEQIPQRAPRAPDTIYIGTSDFTNIRPVAKQESLARPLPAQAPAQAPGAMPAPPAPPGLTGTIADPQEMQLRNLEANAGIQSPALLPLPRGHVPPGPDPNAWITHRPARSEINREYDRLGLQHPTEPRFHEPPGADPNAWITQRRRVDAGAGPSTPAPLRQEDVAHLTDRVFPTHSLRQHHAQLDLNGLD